MEQPTSLLRCRNNRNRRAAAAIVTVFASIARAQYYKHNYIKTRQYDSDMAGEQWMGELLDGHGGRIRSNLGLSKAGFFFLEDLLIRKGGLAPTRYMSTKEQLGTYLYPVVTDLSMSKLAERFQRSTETIQRTYHKVMRCFIRQPVYGMFIKSATSTTPTHKSVEGSRSYGFFEDCIAIGAIDGIHIPISPPYDERAPWRDRSGNLSQNVLAICDFDMKFTDVLVGWEGSTADSTLWVEAHREGAIYIPDGKYVLGDAGFPNCDKCLAP